MENIVYERNYKDKKTQRDGNKSNEISTQIFDYLIASGALIAMEDTYAQMPRVINEENSAAYNRFLTALDQIAKTLGGKIKGEIDYQNWEASIYVILPFVEFSSVEELQLLKDIASYCQTVTFTNMSDGNIRMKLLINYFDVISDVEDTLEKEIAGCPELVAMLEEADRMEKQQLMSDPQIAMIVQLGAERTGASEDEYLDQLVRFLRNPPEGFLDKFSKGL